MTKPQSETLNEREATEIIVTRYMKEAELLFANKSHPFYIIPFGVTLITLSYLQNIYTNKEFFEWKIDNELLVNKILNAKCGDKFESDPFDLCRIKCKLNIFPNGNKLELEGYFVIHLHLILPSFIDKLTFFRVFRVMECYAGSSWMDTISNGEYEYWSKHCPLSELIYIKTKIITIQIELNILRLILKNDFDKNILRNILIIQPIDFPMKSTIKYDLYGKELALFQKGTIKKSMSSDIVDDMWCMTLYPKEKLYVDYIHIFLTLCNLPCNVEQMEIRYTISCDAIDTHCLFIGEFSVTHHTRGAKSWIRLSELTKLTSLTFVINVEIEKICYENGRDLEISNPSQIAYLLST
eukprot:372999_1